MITKEVTARRMIPKELSRNSKGGIAFVLNLQAMDDCRRSDYKGNDQRGVLKEFKGRKCINLHSAPKRWTTTWRTTIRRMTTKGLSRNLKVGSAFALKFLQLYNLQFNFLDHLSFTF